MEKKLLCKGKWVDFVEYNGYEILDENKKLVIFMPILYFRSKENSFGIRSEYIPPYQMVDGIERNWYTAFSGGIEDGESTEQAFLRELKEESGIEAIDYKFILMKRDLPLCKSTALRADVCIAIIYEFTSEKASGDGTENEKKSQSLFVDLDKFSEIVSGNNSDLLLDYLYQYVTKAFFAGSAGI